MRIAAVSILLCAHVASAHPGGNLRFDIKCADYLATPDTGLAVTIDGYSYPVLGDGYLVPPGRHRIAVAAPGCSPLERDVDVWPFAPVLVTGRLPASDALASPSGATDGFAISFGAFTRTQQAHAASNDLFSTTYGFDATTVQGAMLSVASESPGFVFAWDLGFGSAPVTGTSRYQQDAPVAFAGDEYVGRFGLRAGGRIPLREISLSAGAGVGGDMIITSAQGTDKTSVTEAPSGLDGDWYIPLWTQVTFKPSCNWGAALYASYDVHPTARDESAPMFGANMIYEPSAACSEPAGLRVL